VFTSVTGLFTVSLSVWDPLAYEPPTTETVAVFDVSETSSKRPLAAVFGFEDGKIPFVLTDSDTPFTAITAEDGGGFGGAGGTAGGDAGGVADEPPEPEPLPDPEPLPADAVAVAAPPAKGSLLSNRENDSSWPGSADGLTAASSSEEPVVAPSVAVAAGSVAAGTGAPASDGAAAAVGSGVATGVVVAAAFGSAACGFDAEAPPLIAIIVWTA
jgi:hypothetical protein